MIFYFTEHVMGWGGVGIIPNRSVAPLYDLLALPSYAAWSSISPNMLWGGVGWGKYQTDLLLRYMIFLLFSPTLHDLLLHRTCYGVAWGGDNNKQICCSATWSSCFSLLRYMILYFTEHVMGWGGGDNTKQICCSATWSSCFSLLRYMIFYFTEHVMGWGGVGIIPIRSVAPLYDLLALLPYATWSSTSPNMLWGGMGWG